MSGLLYYPIANLFKYLTFFPAIPGGFFAMGHRFFCDQRLIFLSISRIIKLTITDSTYEPFTQRIADPSQFENCSLAYVCQRIRMR